MVPWHALADLCDALPRSNLSLAEFREKSDMRLFQTQKDLLRSIRRGWDFAGLMAPVILCA